MTSPAVTGALAIGFFPAEEWGVAIERWPDLLDGLPAEHRAYCEAIEARTKRLAGRLIGQRFVLTPLTVEDLDTRAAEEAEAAPAQVRSYVAADRWRRGIGTPWPPARNDRCWCGSGRKYKACCGPVPSAPDEPPPAAPGPPPEDAGSAAAG